MSEDPPSSGIPRWLKNLANNNQRDIKNLYNLVELLEIKVQSFEKKLQKGLDPTLTNEFQVIKERFIKLQTSLEQLVSIISEVIGTPEVREIASKMKKEAVKILEFFGMTGPAQERALKKLLKETPKVKEDEPVKQPSEFTPEDQNTAKKHKSRYKQRHRGAVETQEEIDKMLGKKRKRG
jgi:hypothetical protein